MVESKESSHITIGKNVYYESEKPIVTLSPWSIEPSINHRFSLDPKPRPLSLELVSCEGEKISTPQGVPLVVPVAQT
jgi:hypothetical protein